MYAAAGLSFDALVQELRLDARPVKLSALLAAFAEAEFRGLAWAEDFADETVEVSADLAEVVAAFADNRESMFGN